MKLYISGPLVYDDHLPPGGNVQDGTTRRSYCCRRPYAEGQRSAEPAGDRRFNNADHRQRKHERAGHNDRRKRGGSYQERLVTAARSHNALRIV